MLFYSSSTSSTGKTILLQFKFSFRLLSILYLTSVIPALLIDLREVEGWSKTRKKEKLGLSQRVMSLPKKMVLPKLYLNWFVNRDTVWPRNSASHWFSKKVSAIERCPPLRVSIYKGLTTTGDNWFLKEVSAIERCPLFLSAIKRFFYETLTMISSVLTKSVRYREVSAIKHVRYREVPLYSCWRHRASLSNLLEGGYM